MLDERLVALRGQLREWATDFREHAMALDRNPAHIANLLDLPGVRLLSTLGVPADFGGPGLRVGRFRYDGMSALERVVIIEELARGDAAMVLASPGPSMSGVLLEHLADERQKARFYERITASATWTFFGLTEPDHGSDATAIATSLRPVEEAGGELSLSGAKRYVGNAARASLGVVFARTAPGPFGMSAVVVDTRSPGFTAEPLDMLGLRGAQISAIALDDVRVSAEWQLGRHLPVTRRGTLAFIKVFNQLRPTVAAMAVAVAAAAHELVREHAGTTGGAQRDALEVMGDRIAMTRTLVHQAAREVDATGNGQLASVAKMSACRLAEETTLRAAALLGPGARLEIPLLDKLVRDARGLEFMEGTTNIQRLNVFPTLTSAVGRAGNATG
ncbi:acyl-CoA dehydrogenase family protein [Actinoplanes sp. NPDC051346]|uniref:acyl-CoA dehydrogenase family protein n=1 Tax=Actinoplanes sp. NPDC051346 TaxID=3155048 RepID=UPI00342F3414